MPAARDIAVFVGSIRKESLTRKVARALIEVEPPSLTQEIVEIDRVSYFNQDLENTPRADWTSLRDRIRCPDGVLFATPEYNRSVPGASRWHMGNGSISASPANERPAPHGVSYDARSRDFPFSTPDLTTI